MVLKVTCIKYFFAIKLVGYAEVLKDIASFKDDGVTNFVDIKPNSSEFVEP